MLMSNSPMRGDAGYPAGAQAGCIRCAEFQRKRDELSHKLAVSLEARRQVDEIRYDAAGQLVPGAGAAAAALVDASSYTADDNEFYPVDDDDDDHEQPEQRPMQWQDQVCRQMVYSSRRLHRPDDLDGGGHLSDSDTHDLDIDVDVDDDGGDEISRDIVALRLHVPNIQQATTITPFVPGEETAHGGGGFGAVPASAAAVAGLQKHRYDGSGGDSMCVICMRDYKKGRRLRVMPCAHKHRFHGGCIRKWLARSNLCPLCRHALPTADAEQGEAAAGVNRRLLVRVNVNPY